MKRLSFAAVLCVALLLAGSLRANQEDLDTPLMQATVKVGNEKSTGTDFALCRPDPHEPRHTSSSSSENLFENRSYGTLAPFLSTVPGSLF